VGGATAGVHAPSQCDRRAIHSVRVFPVF
jgi:hypothetical protein